MFEPTRAFKGNVPAPGSTAIIKRKTDKLLHLALPARRADP